MSTNHTSDYVDLLPWGPGSERVQPFNRNTDLFQIMVEAARLPTSVKV
jgi:alkaline phosphatase